MQMILRVRRFAVCEYFARNLSKTLDKRPVGAYNDIEHLNKCSNEYSEVVMKDDKINEERAEAVDVNPVGGDADGGEGDIGAEHVHADTVAKARAAMPDEDLLVDVSEFFKVFGDSTRAKILAALSVSEMCVACITEILNMNVSAVSHQLRILRQSKLVRTRRAGKEIYYSLDDDHIGKILSLALEHVTEL